MTCFAVQICLSEIPSESPSVVGFGYVKGTLSCVLCEQHSGQSYSPEIIVSVKKREAFFTTFWIPFLMSFDPLINTQPAIYDGYKASWRFAPVAPATYRRSFIILVAPKQIITC